jgi:ABC-type nitrate/sulfonate/bicarbonate transport system substrate-binding protein
MTSQTSWTFGAITAAGLLLAACGSGAGPASSPASAPADAGKPAAPAESSASKPAASTVASGSAAPAASKPAASTAASGSAAAATSKPAASASPSQQGAGGQPSLTFAFVTRAGVSAPLWMAEVTHAFENQHVTVKSTFTQSAVAIPALIAKDTDAVLISGAPVITADLNGNADLVYVASALNHPTIAVYANPAIKSPADLKGKTLSSDRPGTPDEYGMRVALRLLGVNPADVTMLQLGSVANFTALTTGQVQAATLSPPYSFRAEAMGYPKIKDLTSEQYQNVGVVVSKSRIPALTPVLPGVLAGLRQGIEAYNSQPDLAKQVLSKNMEETDPDILNKTYAMYHDSAPFETSLKPTLEGLQAMLDFLAPTVPAAKSAKPEQFVDARFLS